MSAVLSFNSLSGVISYFCEYVLCMLVSSSLTGAPAAGALVCLSGHLLFYSIGVFRRGRLIPALTRVTALVLFALSLAGTVFVFTGAQAAEARLAHNLMLVFCLLIVCVGPVFRLICRSAVRPDRRSSLSLPMSAALAAVLVSVFVGLATRLLPDGIKIVIIIGFFITVIAAVSDARSDRALATLLSRGETPGTAYGCASKLYPYKSLRVITILCICAVFMTAATVFLLTLALTDSVLSGASIALGCLLAGRITGKLVSAHGRRKPRYNQTYALLGGVTLCLLSSAALMITFLSGNAPAVYATAIIAAATGFGSAFCASSLFGLEASMPDVFRFLTSGTPVGYSVIRVMQRRMSCLLGEAISVLSLLASRTLNIKLASAGLVSSAFNAVSVIPAAVLCLFALISAFSFPLSGRYLTKLSRFLKQADEGGNNPKLKAQLEPYLTGKRRQPFFIPCVKSIVRLIFRYRIIGGENFVSDTENPLVILANHGEMIGPVVCETRLPFFVRPWIISNIVESVEEIAKYVYKYTFVRQKWLPSFLKMPFSRLTGKMSKFAMDQVEAIPVFRDEPIRLRKTFRDSCDALETGDNLLIFPENPNAPELKKQGYIRGGLCPLFDGFAMLAPFYYSRTGKHMRFLPVFIDKKHKAVKVGTVIEFRPGANASDERTRIICETERQLRSLMTA